jgi:hypothetical protein
MGTNNSHRVSRQEAPTLKVPTRTRRGTVPSPSEDTGSCRPTCPTAATRAWTNTSRARHCPFAAPLSFGNTPNRALPRISLPRIQPRPHSTRARHSPFAVAETLNNSLPHLPLGLLKLDSYSSQSRHSLGQSKALELSYSLPPTPHAGACLPPLAGWAASPRRPRTPNQRHFWPLKTAPRLRLTLQPVETGPSCCSKTPCKGHPQPSVCIPTRASASYSGATLTLLFQDTELSHSSPLTRTPRTLLCSPSRWSRHSPLGRHSLPNQVSHGPTIQRLEFGSHSGWSLHPCFPSLACPTVATSPLSSDSNFALPLGACRAIIPMTASPTDPIASEQP